MYDLRVTVDEVKGFCDLPMKPGDYFEVRGGRITIPTGGHVCLWALAALIPMFPAKQRNSGEPNDWLPRTSRMSCPDPDGMVIYRIERLEADDSGGGANTAAARVSPPSPAPLATAATAATAGTAGTAATAASPATTPPPRLLVKEPNCSGCRACELACGSAHGGRFQPSLSRIRVRKLEEAGTDRPYPCRQCGQARCVESCPEGALSRHPVTKAVMLDVALCTKCGSCAAACVFEAIPMSPADGYPLFCDLCGGDPACVKRCATGAIRFGRAGERWKPAPAERFLAPPPMPEPPEPGSPGSAPSGQAGSTTAGGRGGEDQ